MIDKTNPKFPPRGSRSNRTKRSLSRRLQRVGRSQSDAPLRVAIVGHLKYPIAHPYMGGLERFTACLVRGLKQRGVDVTLFAAAGSDRELSVEPITQEATIAAGRRAVPGKTRAAERDVWIEQHEDDRYDDLMRRLANEDLAGWFDVVHNNSINPVPIDWANRLSAPCTTTLHVPVLPRLEEQLDCGGPRGTFVNISAANRDHWSQLIPDQEVIVNSVDTNVWTPQRQWRDRRAVWFGRILPDKGTHYAIDAAHAANLPIDVIGPVNDLEYLRNEIEPRIQRQRGDRLIGPCRTNELVKLVGRASVCLVTPCWEEPFGLVCAEAMSCGTPVAAFRRGGPSEIVTEESGRLATPGDVGELAEAVTTCLNLDRRAVRTSAIERFDEAVMIDRYIAHYESLAKRTHQPSASPSAQKTTVPTSGGLEKQVALA